MNVKSCRGSDSFLRWRKNLVFPRKIWYVQIKIKQQHQRKDPTAYVNDIIEFERRNILEAVLDYAKRESKIIACELLDRGTNDVIGFVKGFRDDICDIKQVDDNGKEDGISCVLCSAITQVSCDSEDEQVIYERWEKLNERLIHMENPYSTRILENGMTVKIWESASVHSVTMALFIPVYPSLIEPKRKGIYHFLEHMVFRRMDEWPQKEIYYRAEKIGGTLHGVTYPDYMEFSMTVLPKYVSQAMEILRNILKPVLWDAEEIRAEKKVVKNQIRFQDYYRFEKRVDGRYYRGTGYEHEIMGSQCSVEAFSKSYVNSMREKVFAVQNCCVVIAGNITAETVRDEVAKLEMLRPSENTSIPPVNCPEHYLCRTNEDVLMLTPVYDNAEIMLSFDVPDTIGISEVEFLSGIIGQGDGSLLSVVLRENLAYTNEIYSYIQQTQCGTKMVIQCETSHEHAVECIREIFRVLNAAKEEIAEEGFLSAKPFYTENREMLYDSTQKMADWLGYRYIYPETFATVAQQIQYCEGMSAERLRKCASELFIGKHMHVAVACLKKERILIKREVERWRKYGYGS